MPNQANITPTPSQGQELDTKTCLAAHEALVTYCQEWLREPEKKKSGLCTSFTIFNYCNHPGQEHNFSIYLRSLCTRYYRCYGYPFDGKRKYQYDRTRATLHLNSLRIKFVTAIASRKFKPLLPKH